MKIGPKYLIDIGNWLDVFFIIFGYANIYTLIFAEEMLKFYSKVIFVLTTFLSIGKTFKTMKSQKKFSTIVTMISNVFLDI